MGWALRPPLTSQSVFGANLSGVELDLYSLSTDHHITVFPKSGVVVGVLTVGESSPCPVLERPTLVLF